MKEVEKADVTCMVDNNVDILLPNTGSASRPPISQRWFEQPLIAEHGFSVALKLEINVTEQTILFDSGLDPMVAVHNSDVLGFDVSLCELVISSHGHIDHAGGLLNIRNRMSKEQSIPLLFHKDAFRKRMVKFHDGRIINLPEPNKSVLTKAGYSIIERESPSLWLGDTVLATGEIPRTNEFEKGFPNHYSEVDGRMESDPIIKDDQAVILNIKNKGLVIITGCGHSGIVNIVNYAKELTGEDRIYTIIGGMHLSVGMFEPIIPKTVDELEEMKPRFLIPCHCTGLKAMTEIARSMPDAFIQNSVGTSYIF